MILEFSIENTFSIKDKQTISFESAIEEKDSIHCINIAGKKILKQLCIYGANASGKTKLLKALYFYIDFILNSFTDLKPNELINYVPFKFDETTRNGFGFFELIFYVPDIENKEKFIRYEYSIRLNDKKVIEEKLFFAPKGQKKLLFERKSDTPIKWGTPVTGAKKIIAEMTRDNCSVISAGAQAQHVIFKYLYDYLYSRFNGIILPSPNGISSYIAMRLESNEELKKQAVKLLSAIDIGNITDLNVKSQPIPDDVIKQFPEDIQKELIKSGERPKNRRIYITHNYNDKNYDLPLSLESAGTLRMLELFLPLSELISQKSVLLIDEIESSLHQELLEKFLQLYIQCSEYSQIIFTTHNQDLLDSDLLRDDEIWFCDKKENGRSEYNCITDFTGIRKEASRKKLYQADKFNALPIIDMLSLMEMFNAEKNR